MLHRCFALLLFSFSLAHAHFSLIQPASAVSTDNGGKGGPPCAAGSPSNKVTDVRGGHPISIQLSEFIFHPGHYRIALSVRSRAELPADPEVVTDADEISIRAAIQNPVKAPVLADGILAHTAPPNGDWRTTVTLPNLNCERCTLQIIQFMAEHGAPFFYHQCADLRITADPSLPPADASWPGGSAALPNLSVFPQVDGPLSTLSLSNLGSTPVQASLVFHNDTGGSGSLANATVPANGTVVVPGPEVRGWFEVRSSGVLSGYALLRQAEGRGEVVVPLQKQFPDSVVYPFDNTGDFATRAVLVNPSAEAVKVNATLWDDSGKQLASEPIIVEAGGRAEIVLPERFAVAAGKRGILQWKGPVGLAGVVLRLDATGGLTVLPPL